MGQITALCSTYCTSYVLKPVDRGLGDGQFFVFYDILTPTTPNLWAVHASKLKLKMNIWSGFCRRFVSDDSSEHCSNTEAKFSP